MARALSEDRKDTLRARDALAQLLGARPRVAADQEILADGELGKDLPRLGHVRDAARDDGVRRRARDVGAPIQDAATSRTYQPGDRPQGRALSRAVGAEQRHDLAVADGEGDVLQRAALAVRDVNGFELEKGVWGSSSCGAPMFNGAHDGESPPR